MAWCDGMKETRVLIGPSPHISNADLGKTGNAEGCILSLRHPKSGSPTTYVFRSGSLQELHWHKQSFGSWFLGDYVCEDGSLYISTLVDPVFIFLPIFEEARMKKAKDHGMFRELDEIIFVSGYPGYQSLLSIAEGSMQLLCEVKEIGSSKFFRLDDSKVLAWLSCKVHNLKLTLSTLDKNFAAREERDTLNDVVSLLGEYLNDAWLNLLCKHLQLDIQAVVGTSPNNDAPAATQDGSLSSNSSRQTKDGNGKSISKNDKQSKKQKTQVDSHNIKDMFRRASRRRGT